MICFHKFTCSIITTAQSRASCPDCQPAGGAAASQPRQNPSALLRADDIAERLHSEQRVAATGVLSQQGCAIHLW